MPKGVRTTQTIPVLKTSDAQTLVEVGAEFFPGSTTRLPEGVKVRSSQGVQIEFMFGGKRHYETVRGAPTVAHVMAVAHKRQRINQLIGLGAFDYESEFPDSRKVKVAMAHAANEMQRQEKLLGVALDEWLLVVVQSIGPNGEEDYRKDVRLLKNMPASAFGFEHSAIAPWAKKTLADVPAREIEDVQLSRFRDWLTKRPGAKKGTTLSYKRILNLLSPLRGAFERLASNGIIARNPFQNLRPLKKEKLVLAIDAVGQSDAGIEDTDDVIDAFTTDEVKKLLANMEGQFKRLVAFWLLTGLRTGELIALQWSDIDWQNKRMFVRRSLSRGKLKKPKFDKSRWVDLRPEAIAILEEHKRVWLDNDGDWIFTNPGTGKRWANESKIRYRFQIAASKAGVRYRRPYNCRHTFASMLLSSGEPALYVAKQMGHKDWGMLIATYGRWIPDVDREAGSRANATQREHWAPILNDILNQSTAAS